MRARREPAGFKQRIVYDDHKTDFDDGMSVTLEPKEAKVTPLLSKDLTDLPATKV
jgi:hypothetical protein